jgi:hypothetical protein
VPVNTYGITAAEVVAPLGYSEEDLDDLQPDGDAIEEQLHTYACDVGTELRAIGVDPGGLSDASDPYLYGRVRGGILGALRGWWHAWNQRAETELAVAQAEQWQAWLGDLRRVRGHATGGASTPEARSSVTPRTELPRRSGVFSNRKRGFS